MQEPTPAGQPHEATQRPARLPFAEVTQSYPPQHYFPTPAVLAAPAAPRLHRPSAVPAARPGGPLGLAWHPSAGATAAPHGPYWLAAWPERSGWRWTVRDSWSRRPFEAEGSASTRRLALWRAEWATLALVVDSARAVSVRAAIAFGDWPGGAS